MSRQAFDDCLSVFDFVFLIIVHLFCNYFEFIIKVATGKFQANVSLVLHKFNLNKTKKNWQIRNGNGVGANSNRSQNTKPITYRIYTNYTKCEVLLMNNVIGMIARNKNKNEENNKKNMKITIEFNSMFWCYLIDLAFLAILFKLIWIERKWQINSKIMHVCNA